MGGVEGGMAVVNGTAGAHGVEDYHQWMESKVGKGSQHAQRHGGDVYSNTLPVRKVAPAKSKTSLSKNSVCSKCLQLYKCISDTTCILGNKDISYDLK